METDRIPGHLVLVGLMGTGKTTVGKRLADILDRPFLDSDEMIEARTGRTVREIFAADGEAAFRAIETEVLRDALAAEQPAVIAGAGGVVLQAANRSLLRDALGVVVWLRARPETLLERVKSGVHRPLLDQDPAGTLARMAHDREPLYREVADVIVDVDDLDVGRVIAAVLA